MAIARRSRTGSESQAIEILARAQAANQAREQQSRSQQQRSFELAINNLLGFGETAERFGARIGDRRERRDAEDRQRSAQIENREDTQGFQRERDQTLADIQADEDFRRFSNERELDRFKQLDRMEIDELRVRDEMLQGLTVRADAEQRAKWASIPENDRNRLTALEQSATSILLNDDPNEDWTDPRDRMAALAKIHNDRTALLKKYPTPKPPTLDTLREQGALIDHPQAGHFLLRDANGGWKATKYAPEEAAFDLPEGQTAQQVAGASSWTPAGTMSVMRLSGKGVEHVGDLKPIMDAKMFGDFWKQAEAALTTESGPDGMPVQPDVKAVEARANAMADAYVRAMQKQLGSTGAAPSSQPTPAPTPKTPVEAKSRVKELLSQYGSIDKMSEQERRELRELLKMTGDYTGP